MAVKDVTIRETSVRKSNNAYAANSSVVHATFRIGNQEQYLPAFLSIQQFRRPGNLTDK